MPIFRLALALLLAVSCAAPRVAPPDRAGAAPAATGPGVAATAPAPSASATASPAAPAKSRALQTWANGAVFYEVFVRSFQDSDGDGKGDLAGLVSRLDYLNDGHPEGGKSLGVDALWLMPVFVSPSYHGYDTTDYDHINPDYGDDAAFARLCAEAHRRGMHVVVDLVLNHTSVKHPWFVESASSPQSPRRDWYVWSPTLLHWGQPWNPAGETWHQRNGAYYYGLFWSGMPDLNFRNQAVRAEARRIAKLWLDRGVDGFRLDAARHLIEDGPGEKGQNDTPETHAFWREFAAYVRGVKPDAALIGETWSETPIIAPYYGDTNAVPGGDELPLNFDFPIAKSIVAGVRAQDGARIAQTLAEVQKTYPPGATDVPFLTNHDQRRVASVLQDDPEQLRLAASVLLTLPGSPFLYYGEEIGLDNGPGDDDEQKRTPMPWDATPGGGFTTGKPWFRFAPGHERVNVAAEAEDPRSLLSHYRALLHLRHASKALGHGDLTLLPADKALLAFTREAGGERVLVVHNLGKEPATWQGAGIPVAAGAGERIFGAAGTLSAAGGAVRVELPGHASAIFRLPAR